uniref:non-specific serine/threonine protein kinase n=1 Tax=Anopheles epiroticus TaxID=199890 RepID=A0A182P8M5_9DIPT
MEEICTQPLDSQTIPIDQLINESAPSYGQLVGNGYNFGTIELCSEKFSVGRDQKCDLVVSEELLPHSSRILISNFHFTLERDVKDCYSPTYIIDSSTNGTFVNGILIGRNNRAILLPGFIISIAAFRNLFVYKQPNYSLPPEVESPGLIKQYHIGRVIGSGSFGTVHLLHHVSSCVPYALKIVRKQPYKMKLRGSSSLFNETEIMKKLNHPCVIRMFDFINDPSSISIVLEYMQGGDLLTRIMDNSYLPEQTAKFYFYQLCHAIHYLHSREMLLENEWFNHSDVVQLARSLMKLS